MDGGSAPLNRCRLRRMKALLSLAVAAAIGMVGCESAAPHEAPPVAAEVESAPLAVEVARPEVRYYLIADT